MYFNSVKVSFNGFELLFKILSAHCAVFVITCYKENFWLITCSEVNNYINEENCVRQAVKCNPPGREVIVKKGNSHRQNYQIRYEQ